MDALHAYINIPSNKSGQKAVTEIVPVSSITKFSVKKYNQDNNFYKNKTVKLNDAEKTICSILFVGESYEAVQQYVKNTKKRIRIPKIRLSGVMDSSSENISLDNTEIQGAKKKRKHSKTKVSESSQNVADKIIEQYINIGTGNGDHISENDLPVESHEINVGDHTDDIEMERTNNSTIITHENEQINENSVAQSSKQRLTQMTSNITRSSDNPVLSAYKSQIDYFKNKYFTCMDEMQRLKDKFQYSESESSTVNNAEKTSKTPDEVLVEYDIIFQVQNTRTSENNNIPNNDLSHGNLIHIKKGVYCNSTAYKDAFKVKEPQRFFSLMNEGIYGFEDLASRCVRKQKNNQECKILSPIKREIVEDEFYKFLRQKQFTVSQINHELSKCPVYHTNSISSAKKKLFKEMREYEGRQEDEPTSLVE